MNKCQKCGKDIPAGETKCPHCGQEQTNQTNKPVPGVEIRDCKHCDGSGECLKGKTLEIKHSCEYCINKAGIKTNNPFPIIPCGYCEGRGFHVIDLKFNKPQQNNGGKKK
ncbi:MAG: zinc-ribbon domain-containing protein [Candidatus Paceibacterota bacterium]|jgi:hypothetical protein